MYDSQPSTPLIPANAAPPAAARGLAGGLRHVRQLDLFLRQPYRGIGALLHSGYCSAVFPGDAQ